MKIVKQTYIGSLPMMAYQEVANAIASKIDITGSAAEEQQYHIALSGRLCDVEELIDITPYLTKEVK